MADEMSSGKLIVHPAIAALQEDITRMSGQMAMLVEERDHLLHHLGPALQMMYLEKVGHLEYQLFEVECRLARTRRTIEMIQACINRQQAVHFVDIERRLDVEQADYLDKMRRHADELKRMHVWQQAELLSPEKAGQIKHMYRQLVKWLHPDVNPQLTDEQKMMWRRVVDAYEQNNLDMLIVLYELSVAEREVGEVQKGQVGPPADAMQILEARRQRLQESIKKLLLELDEGRTKHPFTLQAFLDDELQVKTRQAHLRAAIHEGEQALAAQHEYLQLLRGVPGASSGGGVSGGGLLN